MGGDSCRVIAGRNADVAAEARRVRRRGIRMRRQPVPETVTLEQNHPEVWEQMVAGRLRRPEHLACAPRGGAHSHRMIMAPAAAGPYGDPGAGAGAVG